MERLVYYPGDGRPSRAVSAIFVRKGLNCLLHSLNTELKRAEAFGVNAENVPFMKREKAKIVKTLALLSDLP